MGLSRPTGDPTERLQVALATQGFCSISGDVLQELVDRWEEMDVDEIVDFVLTAEGFADIAYVEKRIRRDLRVAVVEALHSS